MSRFLDLSENEKANYAEIMKAYIDTAKSFTQLSTAALLLPIAFFRQLLALGPEKSVRVDLLLGLTWLSFLVATGCGLLYQYLAVKYLSAQFWRGDWEQSSVLVKNPGYAYGGMMATFFMGAILFVLEAYLQLSR